MSGVRLQVALIVRCYQLGHLEEIVGGGTRMQNRGSLAALVDPRDTSCD